MFCANSQQTGKMKYTINCYSPSPVLNAIGNTFSGPSFSAWDPNAEEVTRKLSFTSRLTYLNWPDLRRTGYFRRSKPLVGYTRSKATTDVGLIRYGPKL